MRPRFPIRRILYLRPFRPPNSLRPFTQNTPTSRVRPQLPFLSPSVRRPTSARFLTTETRQWITKELKLAGKYTVLFWTAWGLILVLGFGVKQEIADRKYPPPPEWSFVSKKNYRIAKSLENEEENEAKPVDWLNSGEWYHLLIQRLEDPNLDGAGLKELDEGGILVEGVGRTGFDISMKSEPWRRGYHEALMGAGRAAEHLEDIVKDPKTNRAFPANVVVGPSNPNPKYPGPITAPKEEDVVPASDPPETFYMRILTTHGFTEKQKLDAALAYATWLDYKKTPEAASEMYRWALDIATSSSQSTNPIVDPKTGVISTDVVPSENILAAATGLAVHHALNSNLNTALPIFLSILRARRSLPAPPQTVTPNTDAEEEQGLVQKATALVKSAMTPSVYPPPPSDGTAPPFRTAKEICEEAGIMTNIGEILYVSKSSKASQEDGLAWTREAVDIAEEQLRKKGVPKDGMKTCTQCLQVGLANWAQMVTQLSEQEKLAKTEKKSGGGWLGFGGEQQKDVVGRWESEEQVVKERLRRAKDVLEPAKPAPSLKDFFIR